jgi:hypothetical protein
MKFGIDTFLCNYTFLRIKLKNIEKYLTFERKYLSVNEIGYKILESKWEQDLSWKC